MLNWESVFEDDDCHAPTGNEIWNKLPPMNRLKPNPMEVIFEGVLCRRVTDSGSLEDRFFAVTADRLYFKKRPEDSYFKGFLKLDSIKLTYSNEEGFVCKEQDDSPNMRLRFERKMAFTDLYARDAAELKVWLAVLRPLVIWTNFHEQFTIRTQIGKGAFGVVYKAADKSGAHYAVKAFCKESLRRQTKGKQAILNEVRILRMLNHPNIVKLREVHETKNSVYLVFDLLRGGSLTDYLCSLDDYLPKHDAVKIVLGLLSAVAEMDRQGVVHRDLKTDNIMLADIGCIEPESIRVIDCGLSTSKTTAALFSHCGTPGYVAPEVLAPTCPITAREVTSKADVFAIGVIFYTMLTGVMPFNAQDSDDAVKLTRECKVDFNHPRLVGTQMSSTRFMLQAMLRSDPDDRISACHAMACPLFKHPADASCRSLSKPTTIGSTKMTLSRYDHNEPSLCKPATGVNQCRTSQPILQFLEEDEEDGGSTYRALKMHDRFRPLQNLTKGLNAECEWNRDHVSGIDKNTEQTYLQGLKKVSMEFVEKMGNFDTRISQEGSAQLPRTFQTLFTKPSIGVDTQKCLEPTWEGQTVRTAARRTFISACRNIPASSRPDKGGCT